MILKENIKDLPYNDPWIMSSSNLNLKFKNIDIKLIA